MEPFKITQVKTIDGAVNAEMFKRLDFSAEHPKRPVVSADARGEDLLKTVVDYKFMDVEGSDEETRAVMRHCAFIPLGIAADGANGNADTVYVLISEQNASLPPDIYRNLTAVLARKVSRAYAVKLIRVESSVVNLVIDFIYYHLDRNDETIDDVVVSKPLPVDPQPGEIGVIAQARSWFRQALNLGASDIHIEPFEAQTLVRMRRKRCYLRFRRKRFERMF